MTPLTRRAAYTAEMRRRAEAILSLRDRGQDDAADRLTRERDAWGLAAWRALVAAE